MDDRAKILRCLTQFNAQEFHAVNEDLLARAEVLLVAAAVLDQEPFAHVDHVRTAINILVSIARGKIARVQERYDQPLLIQGLSGHRPAIAKLAAKTFVMRWLNDGKPTAGMLYVRGAAVAELKAILEEAGIALSAERVKDLIAAALKKKDDCCQ